MILIGVRFLSSAMPARHGVCTMASLIVFHFVPQKWADGVQYAFIRVNWGIKLISIFGGGSISDRIYVRRGSAIYILPVLAVVFQIMSKRPSSK